MIITIIVLLIGLAIVAGGVLVAAARRPPEASAIAAGIAIGVAGLAVMAASKGDGSQTATDVRPSPP